jgi:hypothetical protein
MNLLGYILAVLVLAAAAILTMLGDCASAHLR